MAWVFLLLPGMAGAGMLAPDLLSEAPAGAPAREARPEPAQKAAAERSGPRLLVERDLASGGGAPLDFQDLFKATPLVPEGVRLSDVVAFPRNRGELIPFDDASHYQPDPMFEDLLADPVMPVYQIAGLDPHNPLHDPLPRSNDLRYDDFPGGGPVVVGTPIPEPGTGLLLAVGLAALATARCRRA